MVATPQHIIVWANGMLMAYDSVGQQIPDFQGPITEVLTEVLAKTAGVPHVTFEIGSWRHGKVDCNREELEQLNRFILDSR